MRGKKEVKSHMCWRNMLKRCYNNVYQEDRPTYKGCKVCDEWLDYANFKKFYDDNFYEIEGQMMSLDKDILCKGNKVYSPITCVFVPNIINGLFVKSKAIRGIYPIGVSCCKGKYRARCKNGNEKEIFLGKHNTVNEAFWAYKLGKEKVIKNVADKYKNQIPQILYEAMYRYEVDIND